MLTPCPAHGDWDWVSEKQINVFHITTHFRWWTELPTLLFSLFIYYLLFVKKMHMCIYKIKCLQDVTQLCVQYFCIHCSIVTFAAYDKSVFHFYFSYFIISHNNIVVLLFCCCCWPSNSKGDIYCASMNQTMVLPHIY